MNRALGTLFAVFVVTSCATGQAVTGPPPDGGSTLDGTLTGDVVGSKDSPPDAPPTPKLEAMFPPYGLTWTSTGDMGRAGGLTWTYTGIQRGTLHHIYWIVCDDPSTPCGLSLDGPITMSADWAFSMTDSDLLSGKLVFTNSTTIVTADAGTVPLSGRLTVTIVNSGNAGIPFATVASLGVTARDGKYGAEIKTPGFTVTVLGEVEDMVTSTWTPYLDYYDGAHTLDMGVDAGDAYTSFGGSFYDD